MIFNKLRFNWPNLNCSRELSEKYKIFEGTSSKSCCQWRKLVRRWLIGKHFFHFTNFKTSLWRKVDRMHKLFLILFDLFNILLSMLKVEMLSLPTNSHQIWIVKQNYSFLKDPNPLSCWQFIMYSNKCIWCIWHSKPVSFWWAALFRKLQRLWDGTLSSTLPQPFHSFRLPPLQHGQYLSLPLTKRQKKDNKIKRQKYKKMSTFPPAWSVFIQCDRFHLYWESMGQYWQSVKASI